MSKDEPWEHDPFIERSPPPEVDCGVKAAAHGVADQVVRLREDERERAKLRSARENQLIRLASEIRSILWAILALLVYLGWRVR
jgi:hypothetical protein